MLRSIPFMLRSIYGLYVASVLSLMVEFGFESSQHIRGRQGKRPPKAALRLSGPEL